MFAGVALALCIGCGKSEAEGEALPSGGKGAGGASYEAGAGSAGDRGVEHAGGVTNAEGGTTWSGHGGLASAGGVGLGGAVSFGGAPLVMDCEAAQVYRGQLDLDRPQQALDLPPISEVDGNLYIIGQVAELDRLACLRRVTGSVTIQLNSALTSLRGLEKLDDVGGDFLIRDLPALRELSGLSGLRTVRGNLEIAANEELEQIHLPNLAEVSGSFDIHELSSLDRIELPALFGVSSLRIFATSVATLSGFGKLEELDTFGIGGTRLTNLESLSNLKVVHKDFMVTDTPQLESLGRLGLRDVGRLIIENNGALLDLGVLPLEHVRQLSIVRNHSLRSLPTFEQLRMVHVADVSQNPGLPHCQAQALVARAEDQSRSQAVDNLGSGPCN